MTGELAQRLVPSGEARMLAPLVDWLTSARRLGPESVLAVEFSWLGRRVDLATLSSTRRTAAYELKMNGFQRAFEQALYNRMAFDRSYVVTSARPRPANLDLAIEHGIGIFVVDEAGGVTRVAESPQRRTHPLVRRRLLSRLRATARSADV